MGTLTDAYNDTIQWYDNATQSTQLNLDSVGIKSNSIYTVEGYVNFQTISDQQFASMDPGDMVDVTSIDLSSTVTQPNPKKPFKCNFSFNISFSLNLKIPNINPDAPNLSLLYKIDEFSKEVAKINDILIAAIRDMNCCDIEKAYNKNIVPFFRWFADHPDIKNCSPDEDPESGKCEPMFGTETLPYVMLRLAETLIQIYIVLRPLACLMRPLPGNPWWPLDFDDAKFFYGFLDFFDMYVDYVISGKLVDQYLLQPARKFRQNLQNCITGNNTYQNIIQDNIMQNTINILKIQKEIDLIDTKRANLKSAADKYFNKTETIMNSYQIKLIDGYDIEGVDISENENFITIFYYFIESYNAVHKFSYNNEENPILQDYKNFLENYSDEETLDYFVKNYYPRWYGSIKIINIESMPPKIIYENNDVDYDYNNDPNKGITLWSQIFKNFVPVIQDAYTYYSLYLQNQKQLKILDETKYTLQNYIENIQKQQTQDSPGITSKDIIIARYRNMVTKDGNPGNLCNCLIYTLLDNPKQPALYKLTTFFKPDMEKFLNKEVVSWKIENYSLLGQYMYPDIKFDKDISQLPLYFSEKFINELDIESKDALQKILNIIRTTISTNDLSYGNLINILKSFESNEDLISYGLLINDFLNYLDEKIGNSYYLKPNYDTWQKKVDLYDPYNGTISDIGTMLVFDTEWLPTSMKPSEYYKKYIMPLYGLLSINKNLFSTIDKVFYDKVLKPDEDNFKDAKEKAQALLNAIQVIIEITDDLTLKTELQIYLKNAQELYRSFFSTYNPIDVLKDPNEIKIRSYQNIFHEYQDVVNSRFGTSLENLINDYISKRKEIFENNINIIYKKIYLYKFISDLSDFIQGNDLFGNLASIWIWEPLDIPCECDIFCKIIQYIINLLLQGLSKILNSIINAIINWILNSWLGKLIKIILLKLKCVLMILKAEDDLDKVKDVTDALVESLKQRIKLYIDPSICFLNLDQTDSDLLQIPTADDNISQLINDTMNDVINQETNGGQNPDDLLPDPNFSISQPQINFNTDTGDVEINLGVNDSNIAQPVFQSQITAGLPAKLILSDGVEVGAVNPDTNFPLLNFNCNCTVDTCNECINDEKINNTLSFLKN